MFKALSSCLLLALSAGHAHAQDDGALRNTFYLGAGNAKADGPFENDDTPFSIGFMHQLAGSRMVLGFDLGAEGTMLDSTWGQDSQPEQELPTTFCLAATCWTAGVSAPMRRCWPACGKRPRIARIPISASSAMRTAIPIPTTRAISAAC